MAVQIRKQLRILILGNLAPHRIGGAEVQARLLAVRFARKGHRVTVAGYSNPDARLEVCDAPNKSITTVRLRRFGRYRISRAFSYAFSLVRYLLGNGKQFDIALCYMLGESDIVIALLKQLKILDLPLVVCSAGFGPGGDAARLKSLPMTSMLVAMQKRHCNAINIISPQIKKELAQLAYKRNLAYIPNGVPLHGHGHLRIRSKAYDRSFLFAGRLVPLKGCADLLEAVARMKAMRMPFRLNIVGDGPQFGALNDLAQRYHIDDRITFHGAVHPDRMADHYRGNTILVLPSHREAQGMVVAEAMSFGLPVIVTRSGGPEYTVDESMARICPKADPPALAAVMEEMLNMPEEELRAMGARARQHVAEKYDIEKVADQFIALFHKLIAGQGR